MEHRTNSPYPRLDRPVLALIGLVLVASAVFFAWSDRQHDYKYYQYDFKQLVGEKFGADKAATVPGGLQKIYVPVLGRADRCVTCHQATSLGKLPFTSKQDLRDNYPFGLLTVPIEKIVRMHASSGTTGKPTVGPYTAKDMDLWGETMARVFTTAGVTSKDVVHNAYGYGLFTGGLGFHLGAERVAATVVPISGGLSKRQIMLMEDFGATALTCTPSYSLVLAETAIEMGVDFGKRMKIRVGIFGAEPWTDEMREEIEAKLNLEAFDIYGLTEMVGPGVAVECPYHQGLHIAEDHFLPEIIDPDTGEAAGRSPGRTARRPS